MYDVDREIAGHLGWHSFEVSDIGRLVGVDPEDPRSRSSFVPLPSCCEQDCWDLVDKCISMGLTFTIGRYPGTNDYYATVDSIYTAVNASKWAAIAEATLEALKQNYH